VDQILVRRFMGESALVACLVLTLTAGSNAQKDPGPRPGPATAGGPIVGLRADEEKLFWAAWKRFKEIASVSGKIEPGAGLGPTFNGNSCAQCHAQPAAGGSSSSPNSPQVRRVVMRGQRLVMVRDPNPQVLLASLDRVAGGNQLVPPFIQADGPVLVARFIRKPGGEPDGQVHEIYTIAGRKDAPGCVLPQPDFAAEMARKNVVFRIPTPTFGSGLIEAVNESTLLANLQSTATQRKALGIRGHFNRSTNDGTISRFGWKAQNKSVLIFAAESYNVEMGVTNEAFPNERNATPGCVFNSLPEDSTKVEARPNESYEPSGLASDLVNVAAFMRLSAPPTPATHTKSELNGQALFAQVGCALCHSPTLTTGSSTFQAISHVAIHPYSDYALHRMGSGLADHIAQGSAAGDEFRTAPLWGIGQRLFFLHDGRTTDLLAAIEDHAGTNKECRSGSQQTAGEACGSEANAVIRRFDALSKPEKQDILNFLRSL
jgi:CxxC motif-containing protein (DUF1111 family)